MNMMSNTALTQTNSGLTQTNSGLSSKAMLVSLNIRKFEGRKLDKRISEDTTNRNGAALGAIRANKSLFAKDAMKALNTACSAMRSFFYENTLPWQQDGTRILPVANYVSFAREMRKLIGTFEDAVSDFLTNYPWIREDAKRELGLAFIETDYPSPDKLVGKFSAGFTVMPLPDAADFRVALGDAEVAHIRREIEESVNTAFANGQKEVWERLADAVRHMVDRLTVFGTQVSDARTATFRDSMLANLAAIADMMPRLNVTDDPRINAMAERIKSELLAHEPKELREDPILRESVLDAAVALREEVDDIVADFLS